MRDIKEKKMLNLIPSNTIIVLEGHFGETPGHYIARVGEEVKRFESDKKAGIQYWLMSQFTNLGYEVVCWASKPNGVMAAFHVNGKEINLSFEFNFDWSNHSKLISNGSELVYVKVLEATEPRARGTIPYSWDMLSQVVKEIIMAMAYFYV